MNRAALIGVLALSLAACEAEIPDGRLLCATADPDCPDEFVCCPSVSASGDFDGVCQRGSTCSDAGVADAGSGMDAGMDAGPGDSGAPRDAGPPDAPDTGVPVDAGPPTPTSVAAGANFSCVLYADGRAFCWGDNTVGELGNDETQTDPRDRPVQVVDLPPGGVQIVAGGAHACVLHTDGAVSCWGANNAGQLGDGTSATIRMKPTPVALPTGANAVQIAAGYGHTCAALDDGTAWCWGNNEHGQLGRSAGGSSSTPAAVADLSDVVEVSAGWEHSCARLSGGTVECWGRNNAGQLGRGTTTGVEAAPAPVISLAENITAIASASRHSCALSASGLQCWGSNATGQLGDGTRIERPTPVGVAGLGETPSEVAVGGYVPLWTEGFSCAWSESLGAHCWGERGAGQLGDGVAVGSVTSPVAVTGLPAAPNAMALGHRHTCAISGGQVYCFGNNGRGQLGNDTTTDSSTAVAVVDLP